VACKEERLHLVNNISFERPINALFTPRKILLFLLPRIFVQRQINRWLPTTFARVPNFIQVSIVQHFLQIAIYLPRIYCCISGLGRLNKWNRFIEFPLRAYLI